MSDKLSEYDDGDDDFDEEAEARACYGDLIIDTENGIESEPEPSEPEPEPEPESPPPPAAATDQNAPADDLDDPLHFECYGNLFSARPINSYLQTAAEGPPQRPLFGPFWQESELAIFFADTGIGKSILAVQIAESIASGIAIPPFELAGGPRRVLLFDFEMDERQIATRYSSECGSHQFQFSNELIRIIIGPDTVKPDHFRTFTHYVASSIVEQVAYYQANIVIIDNITWLNSSTQSTPDAARMMKLLNYLKVENNLSLLVLAHTPKRYGASPLTLNDLFGSKMLSNFADSIFAMGPSRMGANTRYLKQLKCRQHQRKYDETNTLTLNLGKMPRVQPAPTTKFRAKHLSESRLVGTVAGGLSLATKTTSQRLIKHSKKNDGLPSVNSQSSIHDPRSNTANRLPPTTNSFLGFAHTGTEPERDHIGWYGTRFDPSRVEKLYKAHVLHAEGKTQRQIAQTLGLSLTTVNRYIAQTKSYSDPMPQDAATTSCQNRER